MTYSIKPITLLALIFSGALLAGCVGSKAGNVYSRDEAMRAQTVKMGTVEAVRPVQIEGTKSHVGTVAGGAIGGLAGHGAGGGSGQKIATVVGAVVGGLAGSAAEEVATRKPGVEITVTLDNDTTIAVVQEQTGESFVPGDRVRVMNVGGAYRVSR